MCENVQRREKRTWTTHERAKWIYAYAHTFTETSFFVILTSSHTHTVHTHTFRTATLSVCVSLLYRIEFVRVQYRSTNTFARGHPYTFASHRWLTVRKRYVQFQSTVCYGTFFVVLRSMCIWSPSHSRSPSHAQFGSHRCVCVDIWYFIFIKDLSRVDVIQRRLAWIRHITIVNCMNRGLKHVSTEYVYNAVSNLQNDSFDVPIQDSTNVWQCAEVNE